MADLLTPPLSLWGTRWLWEPLLWDSQLPDCGQGVGEGTEPRGLRLGMRRGLLWPFSSVRQAHHSGGAGQDSARAGTGEPYPGQLQATVGAVQLGSKAREGPAMACLLGPLKKERSECRLGPTIRPCLLWLGHVAPTSLCDPSVWNAQPQASQALEPMLGPWLPAQD